MARVVCAAALLVAGVVSNTDCNYGYFRADSSSGTCMFDCEHDGRFVEISTLDFDFIREVCNNVEIASVFSPSTCSSLSDLVWPQYPYCGCPACGCSTENTAGDAVTYTKYFSQSCFNCTCETPAWYFGTNQSVYSCEGLAQSSDWYTWSDFVCPPATCTDTGSTNDYSTGALWWKNNTDETCKLCYCASSGTAECSSYSEMVASTDSTVSRAFRDSCSDELRACMDEPSRMFVDSSCSDLYGVYDCPMCDCGDYAVGAEWFVESEDDDGSATCSKCTCVAGSTRNYAECDYVSNSPEGYASCPPQTQIQCHEQSEWDEYGNDTNIGEVDSVLNPTDCYDWTETAYCGWSMSGDSDGTSTDADWDCQDAISCETFVGDGKCMSYSWEVTYSDCYGVQQTETNTGYQYCCSSENCNFQDIDISSCTENTEWSNFGLTLFECLYAEDGAYIQFECNDDYVEEITCSRVSELFGAQIGCYCEAYGAIYDMLNKDVYKEWLVELMDGLTEQGQEWADVFGCDMSYTCDLEAGGVLYNNDSKASRKIWLASIVWAALFAGFVMIN
eukprot:CAMPEP_0197027634 /NCGR_PEP_ID=MMETSP1384-20130603/7506_1 /TAXON_ID=29189 /ORGANISM="Ammonia sp." /LENGTH=559 /DNA_ID=CAMNT_0042456505 /DNA_START=82 /DNA_END=1761 /DNA_ORIENTATION=+